jgi:hypothetical protein
MHHTHVKTAFSPIQKSVSPKLKNLKNSKAIQITLPPKKKLTLIFNLHSQNQQNHKRNPQGIAKMLSPLTPCSLKQHFVGNLMDAYHQDQQLQELCKEVR